MTPAPGMHPAKSRKHPGGFRVCVGCGQSAQVISDTIGRFKGSGQYDDRPPCEVCGRHVRRRYS